MLLSHSVLSCSSTKSNMDITKELQKMLVSLEEITKCSVCFGWVGTTVVLCSSGHGVCKSCHRQLPRCPTCREPFLDSKLTMVVQLLEALPRLCPYKDEGCKNIVFTKDHEIVCAFRPMKCTLGKFYECKWVGKAKEFKAHAQAYHNNYFTSYTSGNQRKLYYKSFHADWQTLHYLHVVDNNLFLIFAHKDQIKNTFIQLVKHIPVGHLSESYYFTLTLGKQNVIFKHSMRALSLKSSDEELKDSPYCMILPTEELGSFVNPNTGSLEVTFEAFKK